MSELLLIASKFFTLQAIFGAIFGSASAMIILWAMDKRNRTRQVHQMKLVAVIWTVMILFVGYVAVGIEQNAVCIYEVLDTLATRAKLSDDADAKTDERDTAVVRWILTKDNPPPWIAALRWESAERQRWIHEQDNIYIQVILDIQAERQKALQDKAAHQVPESRCVRR